MTNFIVQAQNEMPELEYKVSKSLARLSLYHRRSIHKPKFSNVVSKSIGVLVVNSHCDDKIYGKEET